jgi:putative ABC transport system permease protein
MRRIAFRGLAERRARTLYTLLAVILGVALIAGTFVFTDTISKSFDKLVATAGQNVDVRVVSPQAGDAFGGATAAATLPASVAAKVASVDGVKASVGAFSSLPVTMVDRRGRRVGPTTGAPTLAFSTVGARFDAFAYEGRAPRSDGEIAISTQAAKDAGLSLGDRIRVQGTKDLRAYKLVGLTTFAGASSLGGAVFAVLTLPQVQGLAGLPGLITEVDVQAAPGVSEAALAQRVRTAVGPGALVRTGAQDSAQKTKDLSTILSYLTYGLLAFGAIALLVGCFVIFNTFSITVAQRTREFGMLRTIGASRRQVLWAVVLEALAIGLAGSVLGLGAGLGLAPLLSALLSAVGFGLPTSGLVLLPRTAVLAIGLGTLATLLASLGPALRATRIAPMAAMRDDATGASSAKRHGVRVAQFAVAGLGLGLMVVGLFAGLATSQALMLLGAGAVLVFVGVGMFSPLLVAPLAAVIGRPLVAVGGVAARIARGNAVRSPRRTASTASALMVGVALVAFVAIFVNGFKASFSGAFEKSVVADYVVLDRTGLTPEAIAPAAAKLPGVGTATSLREGRGTLPGGAKVVLAGLDPALAPNVVHIDWAAGSDATLRALGARDAMLETGWAKAHHLGVGSRFVLRNPRREPVALTVRGTFHDRGRLFGDVMLTDRTVRDTFSMQTVLIALITVAAGASSNTVHTELTALLDRRFPTLEPQSRGAFIHAQVGSVNSILYVFYALLALSVIIALFGIVNTLGLSVYERTRELGLLRAVGASRRQVREMVRGEAVITGVMGAVLGVVVGVLFGVLVSRPLGAQGFVLALPYGTLAILLVLGALAGVLAAVLPARLASRIDVLQALTHQ